MPLIRVRKIPKHLVAHNERGWGSYILLYAPYLPDSGDLISLGDKYIVSLGAHATHHPLLMDIDKPTTLTVQRTNDCANLLAFVSDSPVVAKHVSNATKNVSDLQSFSRTLSQTSFHDADTYFEKASEALDVVLPYFDGFVRRGVLWNRTLTKNHKKWVDGYFIKWPQNDRVWRATTSYALALNSFFIPSRILNFYRSIEATRESVNYIFSNLAKYRPSPVWSHISVGRPPKTYRTVDAISYLRRTALNRRANLISQNGSEQAAVRFLWDVQRGKSAHADKQTLEYDYAATLGEQILDACLLQYMARVAIERVW